MAFRHEVLHIRRQKQRLIDIPGAKILAHGPTLNQTRPELNSDYSDRLLAERTDFKQLAVVAGLARDAQLAAAVEAGHDGHDGHDVLAPGVIERGPYALVPAELDQVARGRERQLEPPALAAFQRLARRDPDRVGGFLAVMGTELLRRRGC